MKQIYTNCKKCCNYIYSYATEGMCCILNKEYSAECYKTEYQRYLEESISIPVNKKAKVFIGNKKRDIIIKEARYKNFESKGYPGFPSQKSKISWKYLIQINNTEFFYEIMGKGSGKLLLVSYTDGTETEDKIEIDITTNRYLIDLLWEISDYTKDGLLHCWARKN